MRSDVDAWCEEMLPHITAVSEVAAERYSKAGRLLHYRAVAQRLAGLIAVEPAVWKAGFLHGLHATLLDGIPGVDDQVRALVRGRAALGSLTSSAQLERSVLPTLDRRAALVLVIEQLHHVDADGRLEEWAARFHLRPGEMPADFKVSPRHLGSRVANLEDYCAFLRTVVAPVARHVSLWNEADVLEDAALFLEWSSRFRNIVAFACEASLPKGPCVERVDAVRRALGEHSGDVRWEWRHLARLDSRLPRSEWRPAEIAPSEAGDWLANLIHCGTVTIVTDEVDACWLSLARLHSAVPRHRNDAFRDFLSRPGRDGYQALHTEVTVELEGGGLAIVAVRLLPQQADRRRFGPSDGTGVLAPGEGSAPRVATEPMQVFAPDGRAVPLRPGSTVLNFAYKIHNHLPAFLRGAQVNRQRVPVLYPLHPGDVVWLDLADDPRPLPKGWEAAVPPDTVSAIRHSFMVAYRDSLHERGRAVLRAHLVSIGAGAPADDEALDELVRTVNAELERKRRSDEKNRKRAREERDEVWWYRRLGISEAMEREELPARGRRHDELLQAFLARAGQEMLLRKALHGLSHEGEQPQATWCPQCSPGNRDALVFELKEKRLFVHRAEANCAGNTFPLSLHFPPPQYVTALGDDRAGLAGDVLKVLYAHRLGIRRIDAIRRELGKGVIRVRLDPTPEERIANARADLQRMPGVHLIAGPEDPPLSEERLLPPRETVAFYEVEHPPYVVGPPAQGNAFYGMQVLIDGLHAALDRVGGEIAPSGGHVLLTGPKRTGKTSAVLHFCEELPGRAIAAYVEAGEGDDWQKCEMRLVSDLRRAAGFSEGSRASGSANYSLRELAVEVRRHTGLPVVLAFDEAAHMMVASKRGGQMEALRIFASQARATPGLLTLWSGPASARSVIAELNEILQAAAPERVPALRTRETAALLGAQQSGHRGRTEVDSEVVRRAYALTRGNPYWLNALGKELFERSQRAADGVRRYDMVAFTESIPKILKEDRLFVDRYRQQDVDSPEARIWEFVLGRLAYGLEEAARIVDESELRNAGRDHLKLELPLPEWDDIMAEMEARGTILRSSDSRCSIEFPLLAAHIRALAERRGERWLR